MIYIFSLLLIFKFKPTAQYYFINMNDDYPMYTHEFQINSNDYTVQSYFSYGIWSRYTPLGQNNQVGTIGIFDSSCFHLHSAIGKTSRLLNLLLFDCLEYPVKIIKRKIFFKASDSQWYHFEAIIDNFQYEYIWHYFEITAWPYEQTLQLIFIQYPKTIFNKLISVDFPYNDLDLQLTFGGGLYIDQYQNIPEIEVGSKFSFFPGKMYLYPFTKSKYKSKNDYLEVIEYNWLLECICSFNIIRDIPDKDLELLQTQVFTSQNSNCNNFALQAWIKITNIKSDSPEFRYQLIQLQGAFSNSRMKNQNLAAFQLFYVLSPIGNKIVINTYSYTFPLINMDFSDNPFLIQREIDILNDIKLWHYISLGVMDEEFQFYLTFYEELNVYYYELFEFVTHFHMVRYQLEYGNVQKQQTNYLNVKLRNMNFDNCPYFIDSFPYCHFTCDSCDGPSSTDCLSCSKDQNRIYLPEHKTCICPYDTIDNYLCQDYEKLGFVLNYSAELLSKCQFGYFELENECIQCPSIIQDNFMTCLDCLNNPDSWQTQLFCEMNLSSYDENQVSKLIKEDKQYFFSDGNDIYYCSSCNSEQSLYYEDYQYQIQEFQQFCIYADYNIFQNEYQKKCTKCNIKNCYTCKITLFNLECIRCDFESKLINGICEFRINRPQSDNCVRPYYKDSLKKCKLCDIEHCKYCFEYSSNDINKSTLYYNFIIFDKDEFHKTGCALCDNGFRFDFNKGQCLQNYPSISQCIRSYVNQYNIEICTLSQIEDFSIAPEINNCLNLIQNCKQCIQNPQKEIKCVLCEDGYAASIKTGQCYRCNIENVKFCIEGQVSLNDGWIQLVQSFMMQFLNNYFYPSTLNSDTLITALPIECQNGYSIIQNIYCRQYCDASCLSCIQKNLQFHCNQCPLNYYKQPIKSSNNGKCLQCPNLCSFCQERTIDEINEINPNFIITDSTQIYTYKCLQAAKDKNIILDPYINVAKYCYNSQCTDNIVYKVDVICKNLLQIFDESFYEYYEKNINLNYCNEFGVKKIVIQVNYMISIFECYSPQLLEIDNQLKKKIFSLQQTHLQIIGQYQIDTSLQGKLQIKNFDSVEINQMKFLFDRPADIYLSNGEKPIDLIIMNTLFQNEDQTSSYSIRLNRFHKIIFKNVTFNNMNIINQTLIDFTDFDNNCEILIQRLYIQNSLFWQSKLLNVISFPGKITIEYLEISYCSMIYSEIFLFNTNFDVQVDISKMSIKWNYFKESTLINGKGNLQINLIETEFQNNDVFNSIIFYINQRSQFSQTNLNNNQFFESTFILVNQSYEGKSLLKIDDFQINFNVFDNSVILKFEVKNEAEIYTSNLYLGNNVANEQTQIQSLFQLNSKKFNLQNCYIKESFFLSHFQLSEVNNIMIKNVTYFNQIQNVMISFQQNCYQLDKNQLFLIQGVQNLEMKLIRIENLHSVDKSFIQIITNALQSQNSIETIYIENMIFLGNIIEKFSQGELFSLLLIYSESYQKITLKNLYFKENFFHQGLDDYYLNSAGLIYINSFQSEVNLQNISCYQNGLTNSTNPFIFISSSKINIFGISIINHNILSNYVWNKYYQVEIQIQLTENELINLKQQLFNIKNKGGGLQVVTTNLHLSQGYYENILAQSGQIIDITSQGDGIIQIEQLNIKKIQSTFNFDSEGCISIYSKNSLLDFQLINASFIGVYNRLNSAIFTITPSLVSNIIKIQNVQFTDCISLINQLIQIDFLFKKSDLNKIILINLTITQKDQAWIKYFQMIQQIRKIEIDKIINDNSVINLLGCHLIMNGLFIEGNFISPIIKISDSPFIIIQNCNFQSIKTFYPINILHFQQKMVSKQYILIQNIQFRRYQIFSKWIYDEIRIKTFDLQFSYNQCDRILQFNINYQIFQIQSLLDILNSNIQSSGSVIYLESISIENFIQFKSITINQSNCRECQLGLLYFYIEQFEKLKLTDLIITNNDVGQFGCLHFNAIQQIAQKIQLKASLFRANNGSIGSAIYLNQIGIDIINCKFIKNKAISFGGAIYMINCQNNFKLLKSQIVENNAYKGGGIFFNGSNQLNEQNFENSLIQLNNAILQTNNVVEVPHHLSLFINNQEIFSDKYQFENITTNVLKLKNYKIIEQGKKITTNTLMIPSNQIIKNYKIFNPQNYTYVSFLREFQLNYKNSFNEDLIAFQNSSCKIDLFNQISTNQTLVILNSIQTVFYNEVKNGFDLGDISITFDPYQDQHIFFQLQIKCSTNYQENTLQYIIIGRTFKCQLGEFYFNEGCQLCEPDKGFYSVTYNTTKCSIFDKAKQKNITQNQIELLEGFWRPNPFSDLTEECFKNLQFCQGGWQIGNDLCQLGHMGALCEECDIYNIRGQGNYFKNTLDSTCTKCNDSKSNIMTTIIFSLLWSLLQIILTLRSIGESNILFKSLKLRQRLSKILFKLNQNHSGILIKMFINQIWIFALIFTFNIKFSMFFSFVDNASNPSIFMATSLECYTVEIHNIQIIYSRIIILFQVQLILFLTICLGFQISFLMKNHKFNNSILSNTAIYLYISNYAEFAKQFASLLSIRKISNIDFIQGDVSLEYYTNSHQQWVKSFIIPGCIIICFLIPFLFFIFLFFHKNKLDQIKLRQHICYVFNEYNDKNYYWEFIKIWQKTIMIFIIIYFETNVYLKGSLLGLNLLVYQAFALHFKPYQILKFNTLDILTSQICSIVMYLAIAKYASEQQNNYHWSVILQFLIIILFIKLCYPFIQNILHAYSKNYKKNILNYIHRIVKCCRPQSYLTKLIEGKLLLYDKKQLQINQNFFKLKQYLFSQTQISKRRALKNLQLIGWPQQKSLNFRDENI